MSSDRLEEARITKPGCVIVGIHNKVGSLIFFHVRPNRGPDNNVTYTVTRSAEVDISDRDLTICDCPISRFRSVESLGKAPTCEHKHIVDAEVRHWILDRTAIDAVDAGDSVTWHDSTGTKENMYVYIGVKSQDTPDDKVRHYLVHPKTNDLHAVQLIHQVMGGKTSDPDFPTDQPTDKYINPQRVYLELLAAFSQGVSLSSPEVLSVSKKVPHREAVKVESPFDDDLASDDYIHTKTRKRTNKWREVRRPDPTQFWVERGVWEQGLRALSKGKNICVTGPSGCGKTELVHLMAKSLGLDTESINCGATTEPRDVFVGTVEFDPEKGTHLCRSRFAKFVGNDHGVTLLDEITRGSRDANNILIPLLDRQAYIALDEENGGEVIRRGSNMAFAATANVGMEYTGTEALDIALKQRFAITIDLSFPPISKEVDVLVGRTRVAVEDAIKLCEVAEQQREAKRAGDFVEEISTRMLLEASELLVDGFDFTESCKYTILNIFSSEGNESSERSRVMQMIQKRGISS